MRTDDLIRALAADGEVRAMPPGRALCRASIVAAVVATGLFLATLGPRPHLLAALAEPRLAFKLASLVWLACGAWLLVLRLARPGADPLGAAALVASVPILLLAGSLVELLTVAPDHWAERLVGTNARICLISIPLLSLAPLAAALFALRRGAPDNPRLAGACGGLLSGATGAVLYASHCPDDSVLFVVAWYTIGIALVVAVGALCGSRCLRW